ncbi:hypothetical protein HDU97_004163 [Phlyctochytrium planicorne]|nr:hypothetical protein HDU97_004163 [Phlyctochytrium planicorne]
MASTGSARGSPSMPAAAAGGRRPQPKRPPQNLYELLNVEKSTDADGIKKVGDRIKLFSAKVDMVFFVQAYRKQALKHHPDKAGQTPENVSYFQAINRAHQILSNPKLRSVYDQYGEKGLTMMEKLPFLDPTYIMTLRTTLMAAFVCLLDLFLFPLWIAMKNEDALHWAWPVVFGPGILALGITTAGVVVEMRKKSTTQKPKKKPAPAQPAQPTQQPTTAHMAVPTMDVNAGMNGPFSAVDEEDEVQERQKGFFDFVKELRRKRWTMPEILNLTEQMEQHRFASWYVVFQPLLLGEFCRTVNAGIALMKRVRAGITSMSTIRDLENHDDERISRPYKREEKLAATLNWAVYALLRFWLVFGIAGKLDGTYASRWSVIMIPLYLIGLHYLSYIIIRYKYQKDNDAKTPEFRIRAIREIGAHAIVFAVFSILGFTFLYFLVRRLHCEDLVDIQINQDEDDDFDEQRKRLLKELRAPSWYTVFMPFLVPLGFLLTALGVLETDDESEEMREF